MKRVDQMSFDEKYEHFYKVWDAWKERNGIQHVIPSIENSPRDRAFRGSVQFVAKSDNKFWGEGQDYKSRVLYNPSWGTVVKCFEQAIKCTGDYHHVFLEGIVEKESRNGIRTIEFCTGS